MKIEHEEQILIKLLGRLQIISFNLYGMIECPSLLTAKRIKLLRTLADSLLFEIFNKVSFWPEEYGTRTAEYMKVRNESILSSLMVAKLFRKTYQTTTQTSIYNGKEIDKWNRWINMFTLIQPDIKRIPK